MPTGVYQHHKSHKATNGSFKKGHISWNKGKKGLFQHTEEWKEKLRNMMKGRYHSEETKKKLSLINTGKKLNYSVWNKGKHWSEEIRKKISETNKKTKNRNRKVNGKERCSYKHISDMEWRLWREKVFKRDNFICQRCGIKNHKGLGKSVCFQSHHIKGWTDYPELRYKLDNGVTLCLECHRLIHRGGRNERKQKLETFKDGLCQKVF